MKYQLIHTATPLQQDIEILGQGISHNAKEKRGGKSKRVSVKIM